MKIEIFRDNLSNITLSLTQQVMFNNEVMGDKSITFEIDLPKVVNAQIGDYLIFEGERYTLNYVPRYEKLNNHLHKWRLKFEDVIFNLYRKLFLFEGEPSFPFFGTAREHLQLLIDLMNEVDPGWSIGEVEETEPQHTNWDGTSCRVALTTFAETFGLEWKNRGKEISMVKQVGQQTTLQLSYGKGNGLYNITRESVDSSALVTRMYGYGGTRNLPVSYGGRRLGLPEKFLQANVDLYGILEGEYRNDEIFPKREALVTGVRAVAEDSRSFTIVDSTLNFDINDHLLEGITAKVVFNSGDLTGYEFEITKYDHSTKTITLKSDVGENDRILPNPSLKPSVGDKYVLLDMNMPQTYVDEAIAKVRTETQANLEQNSHPLVAYSFNADVLDMKKKGWILNAGDIVKVQDQGINLSSDVRVYAVSYPVLFRLQERLEPGTTFNAVLADNIPYTAQERIIKDTIDNQKEIVVVDRRNAERARRNASNLRQLRDLIFDPDGYFDNTNLKPNSIETLYFSNGAKSQNFGLNEVKINANTGGDPNHFTISGGSLIHYEISIDGLGYVWEMQPFAYQGLDPLKKYYLSARCSRTSLTSGNTWVLSEKPLKTEEEPGVWYFNVGVLYPVADGYRGFDFTKGMTFIVGDTITAGRLQDLSKINFIDLTTGDVNFGTEESGWDWNITTPGTFTIRGAVASSTVTVGSGGFVSAGLSGASDLGDESVRFWAGASEAEKENAIFRVLNNGFVFARNLRLGQGANSNGWNISPSGILSDPLDDHQDNFAIIRGATRPVGHARRTEWSFGTELIPGSAGGQFSLTGRIHNRNLLPSGVPGIPNRNVGLEIRTEGADENRSLVLDSSDIALHIQSGKINAANGTMDIVTNVTSDRFEQIRWDNQTGNFVIARFQT